MNHLEAVPATAPVAPAVGDTQRCEIVVTEADVRTFAELSGDVNPLHLDPIYAREHGFPKPVAHGMLALSAISRLIGTKLPGPGALWLSQTVQFTAPVFVGDLLTASVLVEHVSAATGVVSLLTECRRTRTGEIVLTGCAKVKCPGSSAVAVGTTIPAERPRHQPLTVTSTTTRVAIVTGSSRGVGRAIATALGEDGISVVVHCLEREDDAMEVVRAISDGGGAAVPCRADLSHADGIAALWSAAMARFGRVDILVNNATPPIVARPVLDCAWSDFERYLTLYVRSTLELSQLVLPGMRERGFGRIVNVLSSYAFGAPPARLAPYVAAKSALAGLSRALAVEFGPFGITVNAVAPSMVATEQTAGVSDRARQLAAAQTPMRRLASLDDIAAATRFLASDAAGFITGAVVPVTGGGVMWS